MCASLNSTPPHTITPLPHLPRVLELPSAYQGYCSAYARWGVTFVNGRVRALGL